MNPLCANLNRSQRSSIDSPCSARVNFYWVTVPRWIRLAIYFFPTYDNLMDDSAENCDSFCANKRLQKLCFLLFIHYMYVSKLFIDFDFVKNMSDFCLDLKSIRNFDISWCKNIVFFNITYSNNGENMF